MRRRLVERLRARLEAQRWRRYERSSAYVPGPSWRNMKLHVDGPIYTLAPDGSWVPADADTLSTLFFRPPAGQD